MLAHGVRNVVVCDVGGALYVERPGLDPIHQALATVVATGRSDYPNQIK
jgi:malic enzyme